MKTELINQPMFTFYQTTEDLIEEPINVVFYNGQISLEQEHGNITIVSDQFENLVREVRKHRNMAELIIEDRFKK